MSAVNVPPPAISISQPEPDYSGGIALLFIIMIVVIVAIAIKKRKKKTPMVVPPPSGGVSQTRKSPGPAVVSPVVSGQRRRQWAQAAAPIRGKLKKYKRRLALFQQK